ncbi:MAG: hypothetical protein ACYCTV_08525 [Leptospirales bacterium]
MALSAHHLKEEHDALRYLNDAIKTNPSLSFAENRSHVLHLKKNLETELSDAGLQIPPGASLTTSSPLVPLPSEQHSSHLVTIALFFVVAIAILIFVAGKMQGKKVQEDGSNHKKEMEETGGRLMAAVDKLRDEKNYYLLDHPDRKPVLEQAFSDLDKAYTAVLTLLQAPGTPGTDWAERHRQFEAALVPVDAAIVRIRTLLGEHPGDQGSSGSLSSTPLSSGAQETQETPGTQDRPKYNPDACVFCGADAKEGRTISLERDGKVAYAKACPKCQAEMDQNYQRTGSYAPPSSFYQGGMPFMGGGLSFGDMMLMDWMMHSEQQPVHVDVSNDHPADAGGTGWRDNREGTLDNSPDRS